MTSVFASRAILDGVVMWCGFCSEDLVVFGVVVVVGWVNKMVCLVCNLRWKVNPSNVVVFHASRKPVVRAEPSQR